MSGTYEDPFEAFKRQRERAEQEKRSAEDAARLDRFLGQGQGTGESNVVSHRYVRDEAVDVGPRPPGFERTRLGSGPPGPGAEAAPPPPGIERHSAPRRAAPGEVAPTPGGLESHIARRPAGVPIEAAPPPTGLESGRYRVDPDAEKIDRPAGFDSGRYGS